MIVSWRQGAVAIMMVAMVINVVGCSATPSGTTVTWQQDTGTLDVRAVGPLGQDCDAIDGSAEADGPLPGNVTLASAQRCIYVSQVVPGDGLWLMRVEQRATVGLEALADALRQPDQQSNGGPVDCRWVGQDGQVVITVTDTHGKQMSPHVPTEACGAPQIAISNAIAGLAWQDVSTTTYQKVLSQDELTALCADNTQPVIELTAAGFGSMGTMPGSIPTEQIVCRYDVDSGAASTAPNGMTYYAGRPVGVSVLDAPSVNELFTAIGAGESNVCQDDGQYPFAVLFRTDLTIPTVTIELGGCYRVLWGGDNSLSWVDPVLVHQLLGL